MKVHFHTNLDIRQCEKFPTELSAVPCVGDHIESSLKVKGLALTLRVVKITWSYVEDTNEWEPFIELHLPKSPFSSISDFNRWYESRFC